MNVLIVTPDEDDFERIRPKKIDGKVMTHHGYHAPDVEIARYFLGSMEFSSVMIGGQVDPDEAGLLTAYVKKKFPKIQVINC